MHDPPPALLADLEQRLPLVTAVEHAPEVGSTNAELLGRPDVASGTVLVADAQTAGRGRRGRSWHAPAGTALVVSVALRPALPRAVWPVLPLVTGTALVEAVGAVAPAVAARGVGLKWPNDLLVGGVKAAGILVEAAGDLVVLGIGVNVDWRGVARPDGVTATSLAEAAGGLVDRWALLEALLSRLDHHVRLAEDDPGGAVGRYVPHCATLGVEVTAHGEPTVHGTAVGLTPDGHLRIRTDEGRDRVVTAGEVEHLR